MTRTQSKLLLQISYLIKEMINKSKNKQEKIMLHSLENLFFKLASTLAKGGV